MDKSKLALTLPGPSGQPIQIQGPKGFKFETKSLPDIITALLPYIFVLAGLALFIYLLIGGFELLTSGSDPGKAKAAQARITNAIIGFLIIFVSYWLVKILEVVFGLSILG